MMMVVLPVGCRARWRTERSGRRPWPGLRIVTSFDGQKSRRRRNRRLLSTQDELCLVQLETDKVLDAKESGVREIRDYCKDKIAKHKSEASRLREDREHKEV